MDNKEAKGAPQELRRLSGFTFLQKKVEHPAMASAREHLYTTAPAPMWSS